MKKLKVDLIIPAYNEAEIIVSSVEKLSEFCNANLLAYDFKIVVVDNASVDGTSEKVITHFKDSKYVKLIRMEDKGRGRALLKSWGESDADICAYMDADLSTDLNHLPKILSKVASEGFDIAVGSRHHASSKVERGLKRRIVGFIHIVLMKFILGVSFSDPYCGFKAASREAIDSVFPLIDPELWQKNGNAWFWDTQFLVIAEHLGHKIYEEPVFWIDDSSTTAHIFQDSIESIKGMISLRLNKPWAKPHSSSYNRH